MALIKKIEKKPRQKNVYKILLDTGETFDVYDEFCVSFSLKENQKIEVDKIEEIEQKSQEKIATDYALQILSRGMKSKKELITKLMLRNFNDEVIEIVINKMIQYGYLNDETFAEMFFNYHKNQKGKKKIAFELMQKGIDNNVIEKLCENIDDQLEIATRITEKYMKNKPNDFKTKTKLYSHLISKGFDFDTINNVINNYFWQNC